MTELGLTREQRAHLRGLAVFVAGRHAPGGGAVGHLLDAYEDLSDPRYLEPLSALLEELQSRGAGLLHWMEERAIAAEDVDRELGALERDDPLFPCVLRGILEALDARPGLRDFLSDTQHNAVQALGGQARDESLSDDEREILNNLAAVRDELGLAETVEIRDVLSVRSDVQAEQVSEAIREHMRLPPRLRSHPEILNQLGHAYFVMGQPGRAAECFAEALERGVGERTALYAYNHFQACVQAREFEPALASYQTAVATDPTGFELFDGDRYRVESVLGAGVFGVTFGCRQLGQKHVVKALSGGDLVLENVFDEAERLGRLRSPFIARFVDLGFADRRRKRRPYLVVEWAGKQTLADRVRREGPLPVEQAVPLLLRVASGMQSAHEAGVLHRDLRPKNIVLDRHHGRWMPRIIDFSLMVRVSNLNRYLPERRRGRTLLERRITSLLAYAAPEQRGETRAPVDERADIYAFGQVGWFTLYGSVDAPGLETGLDAVLERCRSAEPGDRYDDFAQVAEALEDAFQNLPDDLPEVDAPRRPLTQALPSSEELGFGRPRASNTPEVEELLPWWVPAPGQAKAARAAGEALVWKSPSGLSFVFVPAGHASLGSADDEPHRRIDEAPREVEVSQGFYVGAAPITRGLWQELMRSVPDGPDAPELPVAGVSWWEAVAFCNQLSQRDGFPPAYQLGFRDGEPHIECTGLFGGGYRLLTESEWEYVCRAGTRTPYWAGPSLPDELAAAGLAPAGKGLANPWGLTDLHGQVWEWCWDWYGEPGAGRDPLGPSRGRERVARGGAWDAPPAEARSARRGRFAPDSSHDSLGFRIARGLG